MTFESLGLSKGLTDALASANYTQPTPIQRDAIPHVLEGRDLCGIAQTGTGKTAAFMLPSIDRLAAANQGRPIPGRIRMLVLAPTRELAAQIAESARTYSANTRTSVGVIFGGTPVPRSIREVSRGLDVLVATPGRLLDLVDQRAVDLSALEILVLDEADQMLDLGFIHALKRIVKIIPAKRQTLFFSATMPKTIRQLADAYLTRPVQVAVTPVATTAERVEQQVTFVNQAEKQALLTHFFQSTEIERALVFSRTKHGADKIVRFLAAADIQSSAIHGNKSQAQRERALELFRSGKVTVLVATDIAARGIDVRGVSHVLNFDLPNVPDQYVHRIGRTARAGADGIAVAFCAPDERAYLKDIEKLTRQKVDVVPLPENFASVVAAVKALKPAPKQVERSPFAKGGRRDETKSDRRASGQRRKGRNERTTPREPREFRNGEQVFRPKTARPAYGAERTDARPERGQNSERRDGRQPNQVRDNRSDRAPVERRDDRQPRAAQAFGDRTPRVDGVRRSPRPEGHRQSDRHPDRHSDRHGGERSGERAGGDRTRNGGQRPALRADSPRSGPREGSSARPFGQRPRGAGGPARQGR